MSMYTTAQLLAANEQKFKFDPLFLRLFSVRAIPSLRRKSISHKFRTGKHGAVRFADCFR